MHAGNVEGMEGLQRVWADNKGEAFTIIRLSVPVSTGFLLNKLVSFVSVIIVGHLGPAELAAAALGSSLINVVGNSVIAGLAGAMSTLCGQVHALIWSTGTLLAQLQQIDQIMHVASSDIIDIRLQQSLHASQDCRVVKCYHTICAPLLIPFRFVWYAPAFQAQKLDL